MQVGVSPEIVGGTIVDTLRDNGQRFPGRPALRRRTPDGWETLTYATTCSGSPRSPPGWRRLGVGPAEHVADPVEQPGRVASGRLRGHGQRRRHACPIYQTSSAEQVAYILGHSEARVCFVEGERIRWPRSRGAGPAAQARPGRGLRGRRAAWTTRSWWASTSLRRRGRTPGARARIDSNGWPTRSSPSDVATLVYTSGTTGPPKGADGDPRQHHVDDRGAAIPLHPLDEGERFLSFLPLSHVAERMISDFASVAVGGETWFARSLATVAEDLRDCRPTVFFAVPRVWEKLQEAVLAKLGRPAPVLAVRRRALRRAWAAASTARAAGGQPVPARGRSCRYGALDAAIGSRIRQEIGLDQAHILHHRGRPIHPDLLRWLHAIGLAGHRALRADRGVRPDHVQPPRGQPHRHRRACRCPGCG